MFDTIKCGKVGIFAFHYEKHVFRQTLLAHISLIRVDYEVSSQLRSEISYTLSALYILCVELIFQNEAAIVFNYVKNSSQHMTFGTRYAYN